MRNFSLLLIIFSLINNCLSAQSPSYFQQEVNTKINVTLDDVNHILRGDIEIEYINNSRDTLYEIYMHLWPNAYSSDRSAYNKQAVENGNKKFNEAKREDWGFIDSLSFEVDGTSIIRKPTKEVDIVILQLNEPLLPGARIQLFTPFKLQIPTTYSRLGHDGQSYQITQWFPKPAVYDKNGWNPIPYLDQGEFFSEFGSYDVSITLPDNYVVFATGDLETESEIQFLDRLNSKPVEEYSLEEDIPSSNKLKTIRFTENNVHDFAWFADKRWVVRKEDFIIPESGQMVQAWSAFYPKHIKGWKKSIDYLREATLYYSKRVGPYPYKTVKAVEGPLIAGGGMEYPTVTIIIPSNDPATVEEIIVHEVGHNWFYGILANNERRHPWLDESINSFYEQSMLDDGRNNSIETQVEKSLINHLRCSHQAQAVKEDSENFTYINYGMDVYRTGAAYFKYLELVIGTEMFDKAMQVYYNQFMYKHVYPDNIETVFEKVTNRDMKWFFDGLLNTDKKVDFKIKKVINHDKKVSVLVKNNSGIELPVVVEFSSSKDSHSVKNVISDPFIGEKELSLDNNGIEYDIIKIHPLVYDNKLSDNVYKNGKIKSFKLSPIVSFSNTNPASISLMPSLGYNNRDGFMAGLLLHNVSLPAKRFTYIFSPMYGFKSNQMVGSGLLNYRHFYSLSKVINNIDYRLSGKTYGLDYSDLNIQNGISSRFYKISPEIIFDFKKPTARSPLERSMSIKGYYIGEQNLNFQLNPSDSLYVPTKGDYKNHWYGKIRYNHNMASTYNPYKYNIEGQLGKSFTKLMLEVDAKVDYHYLNKALYVRGFLGKFFALSNNPAEYNRYRFSSTYTGINDYLYDHTFVNRNMNTGFWSHQLTLNEGGMKIPTLMYADPLGYSSNWMGALNIKTDLPIKYVPIRLFADVVSFSDAKYSNPSGAKLLWDAGVEIYLRDILSIYIPVAYSKDYKDYLRSVHGKSYFLNSITFSINFNKIDWTRPIESSGLLKML